MNEELKSCPFCGKDAKIELGNNLFYCVVCTSCKARSHSAETQKEVIEIWNTRNWQYELKPSEGHNKECAFCGGLTNEFSASPGQWPCAFTHGDGTGIVKWHHKGCVTKMYKEYLELKGKINVRQN